MNNEKMTRREAFGRFALWGGALASVGILMGMLLDVWFAATRFQPAHWTELMPVEEIPPEGTLSFYEKKVALIIRDGRLGALNLECTHLGCLVNQVEQGFFCPCHGSEFGPLGELYSGPAPKALAWHALRVRRGRLWVHIGHRGDEPSWLDMAQPGDGATGEHHGAA